MEVLSKVRPFYSLIHSNIHEWWLLKVIKVLKATESLKNCRNYFWILFEVHDYNLFNTWILPPKFSFFYFVEKGIKTFQISLVSHSRNERFGQCREDEYACSKETISQTIKEKSNVLTSSNISINPSFNYNKPIKCIPIQKFCDSFPDCNNRSDEPQGCNQCTKSEVTCR